MAIALDMFGFLAVVVDSIFPGLALALHICRFSERTSSLAFRLVDRTLYYIGVVG